MNNADRLPLLLFQEPAPTPKARRFGGGSRFNPRSREEVAGYLDPKLTRISQALEAERIRVQATGAGIEPEMALVIELASDLGSFVVAARGIGLEWLAEDGIDLDPSETMFPINAKGRRQDKPFHGRLFLTMTDRRSLDQLLSRWSRWRDNPKADWPRGETAWRDLFPLIVDIRPWGADDRVRETGVRTWRNRYGRLPGGSQPAAPARYIVRLTEPRAAAPRRSCYAQSSLLHRRPPCATYSTLRMTMSSSACSPTHPCCSRP